MIYTNTAAFAPTGGGGGGSFLLDEVGVGAVIAVSTRKVNSAYSGDCLRVRRVSDSAETDIGFDSNGDIDAAAVASFCGASNGYVRTWYDQSGKGNDFVNTSAGTQPLIYTQATGVYTGPNGKYALRGSEVGNTSATGDKFLDLASVLSSGDAKFSPTITSLTTFFNVDNQAIMMCDKGNGYAQGTYAMPTGGIGSSNKNGEGEYSITTVGINETDVSMLTTFYNRNGGGGASVAYANSYLGGLSTSDVFWTYTDADTNSTTFNNPTLFRYPNVGSLHQNNLYYEYIVWDIASANTTLTTEQKAAMRSNINTYYSLS